MSSVKATIRRIVGLSAVQAILAYVLLRVIDYHLPIGYLVWIVVGRVWGGLSIWEKGLIPE